jgi:hypothetical protein
MLRQRIRTRSSPASYVGRLLLVAVLLGLLWYGAMAVLLGLGVPRGTVDLISGYRTAYDYLSGLEPAAVTPRVRLIVAVAGLLAFLVFAYLAYKELPRPYVARRALGLSQDQRGTLSVSARAIERAAEGGALANPVVTAAAGRWEGEALNVNVHLDRARDLPESLRDVQSKVIEALGMHDLPAVPVNVTLTGFDRPIPHREVS